MLTKLLTLTEFGNPILRQPAKTLSVKEIKSEATQKLIYAMRYTLRQKRLGVGLAAPQVGKSLALAIIAIQPTSHRPKVARFKLVIINPEITWRVGRRKSIWEGCISAGTSGLFAKVPRYEEIELKYYNEAGRPQTRHFKGLKAQVIQHEVDHLNGVLFMDLVKDSSTYMTMKEYKKQVTSKRKNKPAL